MRNHFATSEEVERIGTYCRIDEAIKAISSCDQPGERERKKAMKLCPEGGPVLLNEGNLAIVNPADAHSVCFASTGRGKTRRHVYPTMLTELLSGNNVVVNDMKGEILQTMRPLLDRMGYTTHVLDLRNPAESPDRYNPLSIVWDEYNCGDKDAAFLYLRNFALSIFDGLDSDRADPYWAASAADYFIGLALGMLEYGVKRNELTLENIALADREGNVKSVPKTLLQRFFDLLPHDSVARQYASGTLEAPNDTRLSILSVFRQPMSLFLGQRGLMDVLSRTDFSVSELVLERRALFVVSPDETHALGPVVVGILNQIMSALISLAQSGYGGRLPHRIDFVLDEFGNLPSRVPDMCALVSAARSRNIRFHFVLQSEHQLAQVYGQDMKEVILDNVDTWFFMGSRSYAFMKHLSDLAGETTLPSGKTVPLISVSQMQHLESRKLETETLVFASSLSPYVATLRDVGTYPEVAPLAARRKRCQQRTTRRERFEVKKAVDEGQQKKVQELMDGISKSGSARHRKSQRVSSERKGQTSGEIDPSIKEALQDLGLGVAPRENVTITVTEERDE